jgi:4-hydroxy-tetrahydrodipicolinate synthase
MRPDGVIVPMVTPMTADGSVDVRAAGRLASEFADAGVHGLLIAGTSGEGHALAGDDLGVLVDAVATSWRAASSGPLLVGISAPSTDLVIERGIAVRDHDIDGVVSTPPYFFRYAEAELIAHYAALGAVGRPVLAYDTPRYTGNPFTVSLLDALAGMPHVVGLKMSAGDLELVTEACAIDGRTRALAVAQGDEDRLVDGLRLGAAAIIPGVANVVPRTCVALYDAARSGDFAVAAGLQVDLRRLGGMHAIRRGVVTTKAVMHLQGRCPPYASAPFLPLDHHEMAAVRRLLVELDDVVAAG